ncbi:ANTAR domain-containing protein [Mycobacterium sp. URHB0021]
MLRTRYGGSADEAFALLRAVERENVKLRDIASRIRDQLPQRRPSSRGP